MKRILILFSVLLVISPVYAGFTISSDSLFPSVCPTTTELVTVEITNQDSSYNTYTFGLSGDAAQWTAMAPAGMNLAPNERANIYLYITPSMYAQPGNYNLKFTASSSGRIENINFNVNVQECNGLSISAQNDQRTVCSGTTGDFSLTLTNDGRWTETYDIVVLGEVAHWASLSKTSVTLSSGESEAFNLFVTPSEEDHGDFSSTVTAQSRTTDAVVSKELNLKSEDCYDFDLSATENFASFCDNSEVKIPLTIENFGSEQNVFDLNLKSNKGWSSLSADQVSVSSGSSKTFDLILSPSFGTIGSYQFEISADSLNSDKTDTTTITTNVLSCRKSTMTVSTNSIELCPGDSKTVDVLLLNSGRFEETYAMSVNGFNWAELEKSIIKLPSEESESVTLLFNTDHSISAGNYKVSVLANVQSMESKELNSFVDVTVKNIKSCYSLSSKAIPSVEIGIGTGTLVSVTLENTGSRADTYQLTLAGAASQYAQINPGAVSIEGNSDETVYLFVSLPRDSELGLYGLNLIAESDRSSLNVPINIIAKQGSVTKMVSNINEITGQATKKVTATFTTFTSKISNWFANLSSWVKEFVISEDSYLVKYWYMFPIILLVMIISMLRFNNDSWMKDLELLEKDLDIKPRKKQSLIDNLKERWNEYRKKQNKNKVVTKTISKPKTKKVKPKSKKQSQLLVYWKKFDKWLNEEIEVPLETRKKPKPKKVKPKKKGPNSTWQKFIKWLDSEPKNKSNKKKVKSKPKTKKLKSSKSIWKKFIDWLDEE